MAQVLEPVAESIGLPGTPDFDSYPIRHWAVAARVEKGGVDVEWDDGSRSRFHPMVLRENSPDPETIHPVTREQARMLTEFPADLAATTAEIDAAGALSVRWSDGTDSRFHPGWLYASRPRTDAHDPDMEGMSDRVIWGGDLDLSGVRVDGSRIFEDEEQLARWCEALHVYGFAILEGVGTDRSVVETIPALLGPLRDNNFGRIFDVISKPDADSNAYTSMGLPLHVDLATREYMPGLQFLHCIENGAVGGESMLGDSFFIVEKLRREAPDLYEALSTVPLTSANKAVNTDYRWTTPMIKLDPSTGEPLEVRWNPWLRAPLTAKFETADKVYKGLRRLFEMGESPDNTVTVRLKPGEMLGFDNRRILHGRTAYDPTTGGRALRGCYVEREELWSRLRILARHRRAREAEL
ncbi:MAG: TauD/TfdA family dioxygenase [Thalassobaculaceae bacterium]|nr:TauD/TfdA family dioxygenase [Thalassobaculaceae bacterium]